MDSPSSLPLTDFGYDIANYRAIDPTFGQMEDFQALLKKAHHDIKVMIARPGHTSLTHLKRLLTNKILPSSR
uniref:alpha-amylase family glycosyl hydrolase n=1 Tax=Candidatus Minimicrobia vallesae TaxID=2841264 RepID=UPI001E29FBEE|nr:alpha-amylase family glycosyl hydrolase [Candidatus Minimicrobia vallesae]